MDCCPIDGCLLFVGPMSYPSLGPMSYLFPDLFVSRCSTVANYGCLFLGPMSYFVSDRCPTLWLMANFLLDLRFPESAEPIPLDVFGVCRAISIFIGFYTTANDLAHQSIERSRSVLMFFLGIHIEKIPQCRKTSFIEAMSKDLIHRGNVERPHLSRQC